MALDFSIITPSFRNSSWLKLCIASVADQQGTTFEHIVQDSCSDDGTQDWLPQDRRVKSFIEKDTGMYDAINRGFARAQGDVVAYLNCDEQFLPGGLQAVKEHFDRHPGVEAVFANTVVVDAQGNYLCHRKSLLPRANHIWVRFPNLTCAIFLRRSSLIQHQLYFDTQWRDVGDGYWVMAMIRAGIRRSVLDRYTSVFYETGDNMSLKPNSLRERAIKSAQTPRWIKRFWKLFLLMHRLRMLKAGAYFQKPFEYSLYTPASPGRRVTMRAAKPTSLWKERLKEPLPA